MPAQLALKKMSLRKGRVSKGQAEWNFHAERERERATYLHSKQVAADGKSVPMAVSLTVAIVHSI